MDSNPPEIYLTKKPWLFRVNFCGMPYAYHYNLWLVYFLLHFWRPFLCFQGVFFHKILSLCMVSIQKRFPSRVVYDGAFTVDHQIIFVRKFKCDFINPLSPWWMKGSTRNLMVMGGRGLHLESFQRTNGFFVWNIRWWCHWLKKININLKGGPFQKCDFWRNGNPSVIFCTVLDITGGTEEPANGFVMYCHQ